MSDEIIDRLKRLEFHVQLLSESINFDEAPIPSLVIGNNWSEEQLDQAHDIFERFDAQLIAGEKVNWYAFEKEFADQLGVSYQGLKTIILAFHKNGQWMSVCVAYASNFGPSVPIELRKLLPDKNR